MVRDLQCNCLHSQERRSKHDRHELHRHAGQRDGTSQRHVSAGLSSLTTTGVTGVRPKGTREQGSPEGGNTEDCSGAEEIAEGTMSPVSRLTTTTSDARSKPDS